MCWFVSLGLVWFGLFFVCFVLEVLEKQFSSFSKYQRTEPGDKRLQGVRLLSTFNRGVATLRGNEGECVIKDAGL